MDVLITGMSGAGKSPLVRELRERGYTAYDADDEWIRRAASGRSMGLAHRAGGRTAHTAVF